MGLFRNKRKERLDEDRKTLQKSIHFLDYFISSPLNEESKTLSLSLKETLCSFFPSDAEEILEADLKILTLLKEGENYHNRQSEALLLYSLHQVERLLALRKIKE